MTDLRISDAILAAFGALLIVGPIAWAVDAIFGRSHGVDVAANIAFAITMVLLWRKLHRAQRRPSPPPTNRYGAF